MTTNTETRTSTQNQLEGYGNQILLKKYIDRVQHTIMTPFN